MLHDEIVNMDELTEQRFRAEPALFLKESIEAYTLSSPLNRLPSFSGAPIFGVPLVGFASGDDPIFMEYKSIIADFHLTPRDVMTLHLTETPGSNPPKLSKVSVISIVLPIARETRLSNRRETKGPSLRWNHTRWQGQELQKQPNVFLSGESQHRQNIQRGDRAPVEGIVRGFCLLPVPT